MCVNDYSVVLLCLCSWVLLLSNGQSPMSTGTFRQAPDNFSLIGDLTSHYFPISPANLGMNLQTKHDLFG